MVKGGGVGQVTYDMANFVFRASADTEEEGGEGEDGELRMERMES